MKTISLIFTFFCVLLPISYAEVAKNVRSRPPKPTISLTPKVSSQNLPKWFREEMKANQHLNLRNLTFSSLLHEAIRLWVEKCVLKDEDKEFILNKTNAEYDRFVRWNEVWLDNYAETWAVYSDRKYSCDFSGYFEYILKAQNQEISKAIDTLVKIYTGYGFRRLNNNLKRGKAEEQLAYALLLHDILGSRFTPGYNHSGTIYRGGMCNINQTQKTLGQVADVDYFASFSKNYTVAKIFVDKLEKRGDNEPCIITMNLGEDDHCGVDLRDYTHLPWEKEVLVLFGSKVKVVQVTPANATQGQTFSNVTWECATKALDDEANSIQNPKFKVSQWIA